MRKHKFTRDINNNLYYSNDLDGKWCLIVCQIFDEKCANDFLEDNTDCGVLTVIDGFILIAFNSDLGKRVLR